MNHYWAVWTVNHFIISGFPNGTGCVKGIYNATPSINEYYVRKKSHHIIHVQSRQPFNADLKKHSTGFAHKDQSSI